MQIFIPAMSSVKSNCMADRPFYQAPKQARSRESLRRLLEAAESVFDKYGLEGATIERIAREAGLSPASVYRRFRDKDDLVRGVFSRASEIQGQELAKKVDLEKVGKIGIRDFTSHGLAAC
jgi:AcrR family transcriptional regulator